MCGSAAVQGKRWKGPTNDSLMLRLLLASVHRRRSSRGKSSAAMGTRNSAVALRCRSTRSRKRLHVRDRCQSVAFCRLKLSLPASLSSHGPGRSASDAGVGGGAMLLIVGWASAGA